MAGRGSGDKSITTPAAVGSAPSGKGPPQGDPRGTGIRGSAFAPAGSQGGRCVAGPFRAGPRARVRCCRQRRSQPGDAG